MRIEPCPGHRIGEWIGPIDWSYDFQKDAPNWCTTAERAETLTHELIDRLRKIEAGLARGERWMVSNGTTLRPVLRVGMYDGWPYWRSVPTYLTGTWAGSEPWSWTMPSGAYCDEQAQERRET